jgi:Protein of unknown function (DUF3309)
MVLLRTNTHSVSGFWLDRGNEHAWNDTDHNSDIAACRRIADVGLFKWLGYYPGGTLGIVLIIVVILVLMGRI